MEWFFNLISNRYLITGMSSWLIAQILKLIIHTVVHKEFDIHRLHGDGGMPSGHSALVSSLATICALTHGLGSFQFGVTFVLAIIVCHDATGVRQETGKQAVMIKEIVKAFEELTSEDLPEVKLKEFVGHTPIQVFAGMLLGIINAITQYFLLWGPIL
jgi:acid phosphatase family membrane protein YuiD